MAQSNDYRLEQSRKYKEKYEADLKELPGMCAMYIRAKGIHCMAGTLAATTDDLLTFFTWLASVNPEIANKGIKNVTYEDLGNLTFDDINEFQATRIHELGNKPTRVARLMASLHTFFRYLCEHRLIHSDPTSGAEHVRIKRDKDVVRMEVGETKKFVEGIRNAEGTSERSKKFSEKTNYRDTAIAVLMLNTGVRVSECVGLDIDDIDLEEGYATVIRKGGVMDHVYLNDETKAALADYIALERPMYMADENEKALFLSLRKKRMDVRSVQAMIKKYVSVTLPSRKDELHCHSLRKTCGSRIYELSNDLKMVQDVLGHASPSTSELYIGGSNKRKLSNMDLYNGEN